MIVIGIDLYNKLQPPDQIIELLDGDASCGNQTAC